MVLEKQDIHTLKKEAVPYTIYKNWLKIDQRPKQKT